MTASRFTPYRIAIRGAGRSAYAPSITPTSASAYAAARANGRTVTGALSIARGVRVAHSVMQDADAYGETLAAYEIDADRLAEVTADPVLDALCGTLTTREGRRVLHPVRIPEGASVRVEVKRDDDITPDQYDAYDVDDVDAWRADDWQYVYLVATVTLTDGRTGTGAIGGVEMGAHWPGTDESQVWHVVPGIIAEALQDAGLPRAAEVIL